MTAAAGLAERRGSPWAVHVLGLLALAGWLVGMHLAHHALVDPDEARSALAARLMAERGDWLVPHLPAVFHHDYRHDPLEGDVMVYWDKPPLYFWLSAAAMRVLGPTALAARLPAGLAHIAMVLLVYAAGRKLRGGRAGLLAGIIAATAPLPLVLAHVARMDSLLVALMAAMLLAILHLVGGTARPWAWTAVLYSAAGLGLLAKGPEAVVLTAGAVLVTALLTGRWRDLGRLRPVAGAVICLAVAAPWYIAMHLRYPPAADGTGGGFLYEFLVRQHVARVTSGEFGHAGHVPGYLLGILLVGFVPWTIFLPAACARLGRAGWRGRRERPAIVLLVVWAALVLVAFSCSKTQLGHYILPAFPPLALVTGAYLADRLGAEGGDRWLRVGLILTVVAGALALGALVVGLVLAGLWRAPYIAITALAVGLLVAGALAVARRRHGAAVALLVAGTVAMETFTFTADPFRIYGQYTTYGEFRVLVKSLRADDAVIAYPYTPYSFAWYLWPREVSYPTAEGSYEPNRDALVAELNRPQRTLCLLQKKAILDVLRQKVRWPVQVLVQNPRHTLILTGPPDAEKSHGP